MKNAFIVSVLVFLSGVFYSVAMASEVKSGAPSLTQARVIVKEVLRVLDDNYVYPDMAKEMRDFVMRRSESEAYGNFLSKKALIEQLQADLRGVSADGHISLHLAKDSVDRKDHTRASDKMDREIEASIAFKSGVQTIGYLRFNVFGGDTQTQRQISDAMRSLGTSDALIIDLRENGGGAPSLVAFLSSYFVDEDILLWSILDRDAKSVINVYSVRVADRYADAICVLTSQKTYSAAEAFVYTLKHLGRACVVGEATGGGAHLVQMERVNDDIDIRIPVVRAYNPITKSNWEGAGVKPTIEVKSSQAKEAAIEYLRNSID